MNDLFKKINRLQTDSIKWDIAEKECQKKERYCFSIADSDYETAPQVKDALINRAKHGAYGYVNPGKDYKNFVVNWYKDRFSVTIEREDIISSPTVLNALSVVIDACSSPGEEIMIQTPVYHMFKKVIEHNHRIVLDNPLIETNQTYKMDVELIEQQFKNGAKIFVLCNPHNPVARVWTEEELRELVLLAKKYHVLIISDEIHGDIIMPNHHFYSMAHFFNIYDNIVVISAPTKVFNIAGLQIAQLIIHNESLRDRIIRIYEKLHLSTPNLFAVTALKAAYKDGGDWVDQQNEFIYQNYLYMKGFFEGYPWFKVFPLEGTYLSWIKVDSHLFNAQAFVNDIKNLGVFVSPGIEFGHGDSFFRMSLACSREQLEEGLKVIKKYLEQYN